MKRIIIILLIFPTTIYSQKINSTQQGGPRNIYNDAIKRYLIYTSKTYKIKLDSLFIEEEEIITDSLQTSIGGIFLKVIDGTIINDKVDRGNSFILYKLSPLQCDKGLFTISIIPYFVSKNNGEIILELSSSCNIFYSFDRNSMQFKFIKIDCWAL